MTRADDLHTRGLFEDDAAAARGAIDAIGARACVLRGFALADVPHP